MPISMMPSKPRPLEDSYTNELKKFMTYLYEKKKISHIEDFQTLTEFDSGKSTDLVKSFVKILKQELKPISVNA